MKFKAFRETVGTSPAPLVRFNPKNLHSLMIKATAAISIGEGDVSTSAKSFNLSAGEYISITHQDFDKSKNDDISQDVTIFAVAAVATTAQVLLFHKE